VKGFIVMKDSGKSRTPNFNVTGAWLEAMIQENASFKRLVFSFSKMAKLCLTSRLHTKVGELSIKINPMQS
jgi:hypothetical protein